MKILNLVLYSENDPAYPRMREVLQEHNGRYPYVQTLFYMYDPVVATDYDISGDLLRIRGVESYIPGILVKTLEAMRITQGWDYDLLIRTNISTIVDFGGLVGYFGSADLFAGGPLQRLGRQALQDEKYNKLFGHIFISGWCMIFSRAAVTLMMENRHHIDTTIIDDVSISEFLLYNMDKPIFSIAKKCECWTQAYDPTKLVFRNCTYGNRMADVDRMRDIASKLLADR
jgi:hypothetical protein